MTKKRLFSLSLALAMVLALLPSGASALTAVGLSLENDTACGSVRWTTSEPYYPELGNSFTDKNGSMISGSFVTVIVTPKPGCTVESIDVVQNIAPPAPARVYESFSGQSSCSFRAPETSFRVRVRYRVASVPSITAHPQDASCAPGTAATFTVAATGPGTLRYQWYCGWGELLMPAQEMNATIGEHVVLSGGDTPTLSVTPQAAADGLQIYCAVSNQAGSVKSGLARLTVTQPVEPQPTAAAPVITLQPIGQVSSLVGSYAVFLLVAKGENLTYQWYRCVTAADTGQKKPIIGGKRVYGEPLSDVKGSISGSKTHSLLLDGLTMEDDGSRYYCVVSNSAGSVTSDEVLLTVARAPGAAPVITGQPQPVTVMEGEPVTFSVSATGEGLHYEWKQVDAGAVTTHEVDAPTFHYTQSADRDSDNSYWFWCRVWNEYGSVESEQALLRVYAKEELRFVTQPEDVTAPSGTDITFTAEAEGGSPPYTYRWYGWSGMAGDEVEMTQGATGEILNIYAFYSEDGSYYYCVVTDSDGMEAVSEKGYLTVTHPAPVTFTDVDPDAWYYEDVMNAVELGLVDGAGDGTYSPDANLTIGAAIKLAACMHQLYHYGDVTLRSGTGNWYDTYVAYAEENGIIQKGEWAGKYNDSATRAQFVWIFYRALPHTNYVDNNPVAENAIPDAPSDAAWAGPVYVFYQAGILTGSDPQGTFHPERNIQRSEVAAILSRMMDPAARKFIVLPVPDLKDLAGPMCWTAAGDRHVFFTTREGRAAVEFGLWDAPVFATQGPGYVYRAAWEGNVLHLELYYPPILDGNAADAQELEPHWEGIDIDVTGSDNDGKVKMRWDEGEDWYQYYPAGPTRQDGWDNVH